MAREVCIGMMGRTCAVSNPGYVVYNIYDCTMKCVYSRCIYQLERAWRAAFM